MSHIARLDDAQASLARRSLLAGTAAFGALGGLGGAAVLPMPARAAPIDSRVSAGQLQLPRGHDFARRYSRGQEFSLTSASVSIPASAGELLREPDGSRTARVHPDASQGAWPPASIREDALRLQAGRTPQWS